MAVAYYYSSTAGEYTLSGALTAGATSVTLNVVTGLPSPPFKVVIDPGETQEEIVKVTNVAGTTLTVVRGWDGSTAVEHAGLAKVRHMMTAEDLRLSREHENATGAHGVSTVVGATEAQTLSNKDLSNGTNVFPGSLATDAELSAHTAATAAHGATGAVVGTTNTQTLTNKTLSSPTLTGTTTAATVNATALSVAGLAVPKIAYGAETIVVSAGTANNGVSVDLTAYGFTSAPKVVVTPTGTGASSWVGYTGTPTATSALVGVAHRDSNTGGATVTVHWIAIGS